MSFSLRSSAAGLISRHPLASAAVVCGIWSCLMFLPRIVLGLYGGGLDVANHYYYGKDYFDALKSGDPLPSWTWTVHEGLGSPMLLIYPPLFYFFSSVVNFLVHDYFLSMLIALAIANSASGFIGFLILRRLGLPGLGMLVTFLVQTAPIVEIQNTAINGWPMYFSFPFFMGLMYFTIFMDGKSFLAPGVTVTTALSCLAHLLHTFDALLCIGAALAFLGVVRAMGRNGGLPAFKFQVLTLAGWSVSALLGIGLASFFIFPALTGITYLAPGWMGMAGDTPWYKGFILSPMTAVKYGLYWPNVQIITPAVTALLLAMTAWAVLVRNKALTREEDRPRETAANLLFATALISMFFMNELSFYFWKFLSPLRANALPGRFMLIAAISAISAFVLWWWLVFRISPLRLRLGYAAGVLAPTLLSLALNVQFIAFDGLPYREFLDRPSSIGWLDNIAYWKSTHFAKGWRDYSKSGGLAGQCVREQIRCETVSSARRAKSWRILTNRTLSIDLPVFWFPHWKVLINGRETDAGYDPNSGVIRIKLQPGPNVVEVKWKEPPERWIGAAVSVAALVILLTGIWRGAPRRRHVEM